MPWVKLSDDYPTHPKLLSAGPLALALDVAGLCYAARHLTDGLLTHAVARRILPMSAEEAEGAIGALVDVGRWEPVEGGYRIHDYADYNPSRAQVLAERAADTARKRRGNSGRNPGAMAGTGPRGIRPESGGNPLVPYPYPNAAADLTPERVNSSSSPRTPGGIPPESHRTAERVRAIIAEAARVPAGFDGHAIAYRIPWQRLRDEADPAARATGLYDSAEAYEALTALGVEDAVAMDLALTRPVACLDWTDHPERFQRAKNPAGLLVARLREAPEEA